MRLIILLHLMFFPLIPKAQVINTETLDKVRKNILSYHIRYSLPYDIGLADDGCLLVQDGKYKFEWLSSLGNLSLRLLVSQCSELSYPLSDYKLFEIKKHKFGFVDKDGVLKYLSDMTSFTSDEKYLIAINDSNQIKFISGNMFLHRISEDFDFQNDSGIINYIRIRLYNYELDNIDFIKKRKGIIYLKAFSKSENLNTIIKIDTKNNYNTTIYTTDNNGNVSEILNSKE